MRSDNHETEGRERFQLDPQGEKKCLKMRHELGNPFPDGECFLAEMIKTMPPLAGHYSLRILIGISPAKQDEK